MPYRNDLSWQNFVHNIVWLRKSNNFSEEKMAEILGISVEMLKQTELGNGADILCADVFYEIYDFFGIRPNAMLCSRFD